MTRTDICLFRIGEHQIKSYGGTLKINLMIYSSPKVQFSCALTDTVYQGCKGLHGFPKRSE